MTVFLRSNRAFFRSFGAATLFATLGATSVYAQNVPAIADPEGLLITLQKLEQRMEERKKAQEEDRKLIDQIKAQLGDASNGGAEPPAGDGDENDPIAINVPPNPNVPGICRMANRNDFERAFDNPNEIQNCDFGLADGQDARKAGDSVRQARLAASEDGEFQSYSTGDGYSGIPGRVGQALGLQATLNFANSDNASVSYTYGIKGRIVGDEKKDGNTYRYQRPILQKITGRVSTPISSGKNSLIDFSNGFDLTSGTSFKLAFDYQAFQKQYIDPQTRNVLDPKDKGPNSVLRRTLNFLNKARAACTKDKARKLDAESAARRKLANGFGQNANDIFKPQTPPWAKSCEGEGLISWIFRLENKNGDEVLASKDLAAEYINLFWADPKAKPIPQLGWGISAEYSPRDFTYSQGMFTVNSEGKRSFDRTQPLMLNPDTSKPFKDSKDIWVLEAYGSFFESFDDSPPALRIYPEGFMGIASLKYVSTFEFPSDAKGVEVCDVSDPTIILTSCNSINIDAPRSLRGFTGGLEGRFVFRNVPVVDLVGVAPKFEYRFDDGQKIFDLPIYITANDKGIGTTGIRLRGAWDGVDLLDQPSDSEWNLSFFFSSTLDFLAN